MLWGVFELIERDFEFRFVVLLRFENFAPLAGLQFLNLNTNIVALNRNLQLHDGDESRTLEADVEIEGDGNHGGRTMRLSAGDVPDEKDFIEQDFIEPTMETSLQEEINEWANKCYSKWSYQHTMLAEKHASRLNAG